MDFPENREQSGEVNAENSCNTNAGNNIPQSPVTNPAASQNGYMGNKQLVPENNSFTGQQNSYSQPQYSVNQSQPYPPPYYGNQPSPSQIYESYRTDSTSPQYHYGRPFPPADDGYIRERQLKEARRREAKRSLKKSGTFAGLAMFLFLIFSGLFSSVLSVLNLFDKYNTDPAFSSAIGILYSVITVALPFAIIGVIIKSKGHKFEIPFNAPCSPPFKTILLIFIGLGWCLVANSVTNTFTAILENFGIYFEYSTGPDPTNLKELILMFLSVSVIPPLTEELAMRGVILQSMKKHGNAFAILASAFVFGVFHGNPAQIPFAFMCGIILGFVCIESGSIWTSIIIHSLVNSLSVIYSAVEIYSNENTADIVLTALSGVIFAAGAVSLLIYFVMYRKQSVPLSDKVYPDLSLGARFKSFLSSPVVIAATLVFLGEAAMQISFHS